MQFVCSLKMYHSFLIAASLQIVFAMPPGPAATQFHFLHNEEMAIKGISPAPTPDPRKRNPASLFERQAEVPMGVETCGFDRGDWDEPVTCSKGVSCLFNTAILWFGCCADKASCADKVTWCVPGKSVSNTIQRISTLTCTNAASTECLTYLNVRMDQGVTYTKYQCAVTGGPAYLYFDATNSPSSTSTVPISIPLPTIPPPPNSDPKNPTPVGAIVGGVIGGIATLALIGFGIFFLMRRRKAAASGPIPYNQPVHIDTQSHPAPTMVPETSQFPNENQTPRVDTKEVVPVMGPSSPSPPYQPPYSPTQKSAQPHEANIAQLP